MLRRWSSFALVVVAAAAVARCNFLDTTGVGAVTHLVVSVELDAAEVAAGATVDVAVLIVNSGADPATIAVTADCFGLLSVRRDGTAREFRTEPAPCWSVVGPLTIEPEDTLRHAWRIEAATPAGEPVPPGTYEIFVDMNGRLPRGPDLPDVRRELVVTG